MSSAPTHSYKLIEPKEQSREEMEVLFMLLAERHSVLLTSHLAFSNWDQIFKDTMTTAAANDRLVHHSVIIELNAPTRQHRSKMSPSSGT